MNKTKAFRKVVAPRVGGPLSRKTKQVDNFTCRKTVTQSRAVPGEVSSVSIPQQHRAGVR